MLRFLRSDVLTQPLSEKKFAVLCIKVTGEFRKLELEFLKLFGGTKTEGKDDNIVREQQQQGEQKQQEE